MNTNCYILRGRENNNHNKNKKLDVSGNALNTDRKKKGRVECLPREKSTLDHS